MSKSNHSEIPNTSPEPAGNAGPSCAESTGSATFDLAPKVCPKCGAQTRDPFGGGVVIHDIFRCGGPALPNKKSNQT